MGNLTTRGLLKSDGPDLISGFPQWKVPISHHQNSRVLDSRFPEMGNLTTRGLLNRTTQIHFGAFTLIHWGFNPRVSPDRSNGCRVFQPRSDGSDRFLTCAFSHDFLDGENSTVQMFSWTLGIYDPDLFATHEDTESHRGKALNILLSPTKSNGHE
jgi:hypothetical protein